jgi:hypothetical protein
MTFKQNPINASMTLEFKFHLLSSNGRGKGLPRTGHEGPEGE